MPHHTRAPYFPANLEYYAPWVATHGLLAPYGECQCGCGQPAPIAKKTNTENGRRRGYPVRFIHGHNGRTLDDAPEGFKTCTGCGAVKPLTEYYLPATGCHDSKCKECVCASVREYHHANRNERLAYSAEYQRRNKEKLTARERERRADPAYREKCAQELKQWREQNREHVAAYNRSLQVKARSAVNKAVQRGKLPPPNTMVCENCQEALAAHYHHTNGYEREHWFDIAALCTECHGREHWVNQ